MKLPTLTPRTIPAGIGAKIDLRQVIKSDKEEVQKLVDQLTAELDAVEKALFEQMEKEGTTNGGGKSATVSIVESVVPNVKDWNAFYAFIARMKYFHLLERRPSVSGCRELFETKGAIPGVEPFNRKRLNFSAKKG
jgi:hypothetical protein